MEFNEDLLQYIWQFGRFNKDQLRTQTGEEILILSPGTLNKNAGPDFENARIRIAETNWAGNVEIHVFASDWYKHGHQSNQMYDSVILHVVFENDAPVYRVDGSEIPTIILQGRIPEDIVLRYRVLMQNLNWIPCESQIGTLNEFYVKNWLSRMLIDRLEQRSKQVEELLTAFKGSWDDAFYITLARNFGFKTNAVPFELMARALPPLILAKHKNAAIQIEALIFGQAGFLEKPFTGQYPQKLRQEYRFLRKKYSLKPIDQFVWKFMRLRPQNFPTLRLAQFAALVVKSGHLFSAILANTDARAIRELFTGLPINPYWETHYRFEKESKNVYAQIGDESIANILINTVALFLFCYGRYAGNEHFCNRALALLEYLPPEPNQVTRRFNAIGVRSPRADSTQALIQLKKVYCDQKKCLTCGIGVRLINLS